LEEDRKKREAEDESSKVETIVLVGRDVMLTWKKIEKRGRLKTSQAK